VPPGPIHPHRATCRTAIHPSTRQRQRPSNVLVQRRHAVPGSCDDTMAARPGISCPEEATACSHGCKPVEIDTANPSIAPEGRRRPPRYRRRHRPIETLPNPHHQALASEQDDRPSHANPPGRADGRWAPNHRPGRSALTAGRAVKRSRSARVARRHHTHPSARTTPKAIRALRARARPHHPGAPPSHVDDQSSHVIDEPLAARTSRTCDGAHTPWCAHPGTQCPAR